MDSENILPLSLFHNNIRLPYDDEILFSDLPLSKITNFEQWYDKFGNENIGLYKKEINSYNYRSDEFIKKHDGKHLLFAGCSQTWGTGVLLEENWSYKLYNKIANHEKTSGYYNVAVPAASIFSQIVTIIKYCQEYGKPKLIFFNIPKLDRFYAYNDKLEKIVDGFYNDHPLINLLSYQYYFMLDVYCKTNKINLFTFSWADSDESVVNSKIGDFKTFYKINQDEMIEYVYHYKKNNKDSEYLEIARDGQHLGVAYHSYWSDFIYKKYLDSL
jgi:hypothetical protein